MRIKGADDNLNLVSPHQNTLFGFHRLVKTQDRISDPIELTFN